VFIPLTGALEAILFAAGSDGLSEDEICRILEIPPDALDGLLEQLQALYRAPDRGLQVRRVADRWVLCTREDHGPYLARMARASAPAPLSAAALEVLAIVAYRQPISRIGIEALRGVQSDSAIATLVHRRLITEVGREDGPGRPILYGTTDVFLRAFGLRSLEDLPPLPDDEPPTAAELSLFQLRPAVPRD
jgi:segregation and condensation protein B